MLTLLVWSTTALAALQSRAISGVVQTEDGTRLSGVAVRVTNVGGRPTSDSGEFTIPLPPQFEPGSEVEFYVAGWLIKSPYQGKEFVPKDATATVHIVVVRNPNRNQGQHATDSQPKAGAGAIRREH